MDQPKPFLIRCLHCKWARPTLGIKAELEDLFEIKPGCQTCGKWRKFRCPKCGTPSLMKRVRGNAGIEGE